MRTRTVRSVLLMLAFSPLLTAAPSDPQSAVASNTTKAITEQPTARLSPEVRLRKLHLVRPDLIPYPIQLEVYC